MGMSRFARCAAVVAVGVLAVNSGEAPAQGTGFTYQGRLTAEGAPVDGEIDARFRLHDAATDGGTVGPLITVEGLAVSDGVFTVTLDFGPNALNGQPRWLEIAVDPEQDATFETLSPRTAILPVPYAMQATTSVALRSPNGAVQDVVVTDNEGRVTIGPVIVESERQLIIGGDGSIEASSIGTSDTHPFDIVVDNKRVFRVEAGERAPNVIGGSEYNYAHGYGSQMPPASGATISGGGHAFNETFLPNRVREDFGTVSGGLDNETNGYAAFVGGGRSNSADYDFAAVVGGRQNSADGIAASIVGGENNFIVDGDISFIGGGESNKIEGDYLSAIVGGRNNTIQFGEESFIGGGSGNSIYEGGRGFIGGGGENELTENAHNSVIAGGWRNKARADTVAIGGGSENVVEDGAGESVIAGGSRNFISGGCIFSVIGGGEENEVHDYFGVIAGGQHNVTLGEYSTIGGGSGNKANHNHTTIAGGSDNVAGGWYSFIGGGLENEAMGDYDVIAGGRENSSEGVSNFIGGGYDNRIGGHNEGDGATISGGRSNHAESSSTISGGIANRATGEASTVAGGYGNIASGSSSMVAGGGENEALGEFSFAAGYSAKALHDGAFVWSSYWDGLDSIQDFEFAARAPGGFRFVTNTDEIATGATLPAGEGSWVSLSDAAAKDDITTVDPRAVLQRLLAMPVSTWRYKGADARHMGPTSQDFHAAFGLNGDNDKGIATVDIGGVAFAGIQGLHAQMREENARLQRENEELRANQAAMLERLERLEKLMGES